MGDFSAFGGSSRQINCGMLEVYSQLQISEHLQMTLKKQINSQENGMYLQYMYAKGKFQKIWSKLKINQLQHI